MNDNTSIKELINNFFFFYIVDTFIVLVISIIVYAVVHHIFIKGLKSKIESKISKRNKTFVKLFNSAVKYGFIIITFLIILQINGVNVSSILAGVGIVGVVLGLAVQDALKDIIRGFNIISDDYFSVGDIVIYNGMTARITSLGLNSTKMKNIMNGNLVTVANRNIEQIEILSKLIYINVPLSYELKLKDAERVMNEIVKSLNDNKNIDEAKYLGVNNFNESSIDYLLMIECDSDIKFQTRRDSLNIILQVLEKNNIEIPYNQLDIHNK